MYKLTYVVGSRYLVGTGITTTYMTIEYHSTSKVVQCIEQRQSSAFHLKLYTIETSSIYSKRKMASS